jgi:transposase
MSYIVEKKSGKSVYLYEVTSYWDPEKKQARQTRRYLGKKDPSTGEAHRPRNHMPRQARDYGNIYLLQEIARQMGVSSILQTVFGEDAAPLLALALFDISEAAPLYLFPSWAECTYIESVPAFSSGQLSEFTHRLGQMDREREEFFQLWAARCSPVPTIVFDITSLSSYSALLNEVEWGYNRDHEQLPQVNLGIVYAEKEQLPLYYQLYPGSIRDVSTLPNIVEYLSLLGLTPTLFVMDRGFYSATNLATMNHAALPFLIPLPRSVKLFRDLVSHHHAVLSSLPKSFLFHDQVLGHVQTTATVKNLSLQAHLYFDPVQHQTQTLRFLKSLWAAESMIRSGTFQSPTEMRQALKEQCSGATKFFRITKKRPGQIALYRDHQTLEQHLMPLGITVFLTNSSDLERAQLLTLYRQKDFLEKTFDTLKHEIDGKRLRAHTADTLMGRVFLKFISLIVYAGLTNTMRSHQMFRRYSVRELLYELKKLRLVEMNNGKQVLTECSKRQKEIFKEFQVPVPTIETSLPKS